MPAFKPSTKHHPKNAKCCVACSKPAEENVDANGLPKPFRADFEGNAICDECPFEPEDD